MQTQRYEIDAFLGEDEHYTAEQRDLIAEEYFTWERNIAPGIDADEREQEGTAVLSAIAQRVAGDLDLDALAAADRTAQQAAAAARLELKAAVIALALPRHISESEAERRAGVTRMTVRSWLGK